MDCNKIIIKDKEPIYAFRARHRDIPELLLLAEESYINSHFNKFGLTFDEGCARESFINLIADADIDIYILRTSASNPIGYFIMYYDKQWSRELIAFENKLFIKTKGLGRYVLKFMMGLAKKRGAKVFMASADSGTKAAINTYRRVGLIETGSTFIKNIDF